MKHRIGGLEIENLDFNFFYSISRGGKVTKAEKSKIIAETHKLLDRAEQIFNEMIDRIIKNGGKDE